ncbi:hypothetical protein [Propionivibrio dicarboxylicus]|uniref:Uncharacterized protein n=1 Tax=Propionivibrio dicarboxylicus TaxID=83767 RepID=A0A1G8DY34_9RHOO|nr:hypothetical protein [Propionivibrio dicarboxylicus]SDH62461.1 hypothetical protein SAMN05660652_01976 [Propionivibrio dicarboxylicus]
MLCIASHDAGGAEVLASWLARNRQECRLLLAGPAVRVFERRLNRQVVVDRFENAINECDAFLTGSSWQSDLEWRVIEAARQQDKNVITFLDHWGNYRERFLKNGRECLPDVIWTGDDEAFALARPLFPEIEVKQVRNPYFDDIRETVSALADKQAGKREAVGLRILFVCEPLSEHGLLQYGDALHWGYTEFDALRFFFANMSRLGSPVHSVIIRPHPSEKPGKYDEIARELATASGLDVTVGGQVPLLNEIADCQVVAGCESMAMVVGMIAGRRIISAIPPGGRPCSLPHRQIEKLTA